MLRIASILLIGLALAGAAEPAYAQDLFRTIIGPRRTAPPPAQAAPAPARSAPKERKEKEVRVIETPPAYEGEMKRLAEILGALHYLRPLCGAADGSRWRNEMQNLIETEQPPPDRRDGLVASFNRSFVAYEQTYRTCTPAAGLAIRRYLDEGAKLSREIATRYGS